MKKHLLGELQSILKTCHKKPYYEAVLEDGSCDVKYDYLNQRNEMITADDSVKFDMAEIVETFIFDRYITNKRWGDPVAEKYLEKIVESRGETRFFEKIRDVILSDDVLKAKFSSQKEFAESVQDFYEVLYETFIDNKCKKLSDDEINQIAEKLNFDRKTVMDYIYEDCKEIDYTENNVQILKAYSYVIANEECEAESQN